MGSIYLRGKTYWIQYYRNGKPYRESTKSKKEVDAKRLLKLREGEISQGKLPGIYFDKVGFDELADDFLLDYRINQRKSLVRAKRSTNHLKKCFEGMRATQITTPKIQSYIEDRLNEKAAPASINRELSALKRMFSLGARQYPPKVDRPPYIPLLKENNTRKGYFEHNEFLALRDALPDYLKTIVTFGYTFGWRISEILNLTWDKIDLPNGIVRIDTGEAKNDEARTVYLDDELKEMFRKLFINRRFDMPYVFLRDGEPIRGFRKAWLKACKDAKVKGKLFHDLRRTAIRDMVRAGTPERVAMMISGHKTRSVFERYNIVNDKDLQQATARHTAYIKTQSENFTDTKTSTIHDFQEKRANQQCG